MEKYNLSNDTFISNIERANAAYELLKKTPYALKHKPEVLFTLISTAVSLGIDPLRALNGGLYFVGEGKIEMLTVIMTSLILQKKHTYIKDDSDPTICYVTGTRADTGAFLKTSFSMQDAIVAGIDKNPNFKKYPKDMLFARAFSRLARQLFADVIGNCCYVEGELSDIKEEPAQQETSASKQETISDDQYIELVNILSENPETAENVNNVLSERNIIDLKQIPILWFERIMKRAAEEAAKREDSVSKEAVNE
jgi:hypothetical protein